MFLIGPSKSETFGSLTLFGVRHAQASLDRVCRRRPPAKVTGGPPERRSTGQGRFEVSFPIAAFDNVTNEGARGFYSRKCGWIYSSLSAT